MGYSIWANTWTTIIHQIRWKRGKMQNSHFRDNWLLETLKNYHATNTILWDAFVWCVKKKLWNILRLVRDGIENVNVLPHVPHKIQICCATTSLKLIVNYSGSSAVYGSISVSQRNAQGKGMYTYVWYMLVYLYLYVRYY